MKNQKTDKMKFKVSVYRSIGIINIIKKRTHKNSSESSLIKIFIKIIQISKTDLNF